jgi:hypothetical protein
MIVQQAEYIESLLYRKDQLVRDKQNVTAYKTRLQQLQTLTTKMINVMQTLTVFRSLGLETGTEPLDSYAEQIYQLITEMKTRFSRDAEWMKEAGSLDDLKRKIDDYTKKMTEQLRVSWKAYVERELPSLPTDVLSVLDKIPAFRQTVQGIREAYVQLYRLQETLPKTVEEVTNIDEVKQGMKALWDKLGGDNVPPEVLQFLRMASLQGGAGLELYNENIKTWLEQQGLSTSFRICIKA